MHSIVLLTVLAASSGQYAAPSACSNGQCPKVYAQQYPVARPATVAAYRPQRPVYAPTAPSYYPTTYRYPTTYAYPATYAAPAPATCASGTCPRR